MDAANRVSRDLQAPLLPHENTSKHVFVWFQLLHPLRVRVVFFFFFLSFCMIEIF